jgi:hypothetical protein
MRAEQLPTRLVRGTGESTVHTKLQTRRYTFHPLCGPPNFLRYLPSTAMQMKKTFNSRWYRLLKGYQLGVRALGCH